MYQDRSEDLDTRVSKVLDEGPKITKALEQVNGALQEMYKLKEERNIHCVDFSSDKYRNITATLYYLPEGWDYTKEHEESLEKLNQVCLDAYIVFLECEREDLIKRWNAMAKDLKPEKK